MLDWKSLLHLIYLRYSLTGRWNFKVTTEFVEKKLLHLLISLNETHSKSRRSECSIKQLFWNFSQSLQERIFKVCNFTKTKTSMQRRIQGKEEGSACSPRPPPPPPFFCNHLVFFVFVFVGFFAITLKNYELCYVYPNTIETCLTLTSNHLLFGRQLL